MAQLVFSPLNWAILEFSASTWLNQYKNAEMAHFSSRTGQEHENGPIQKGKKQLGHFDILSISIA